MALASKEVLEKFSKQFERQMLDTVILGTGFISFGCGKVEHVRFEDVFISYYQSLLNKYQEQGSELIICSNLEF